MAVIRVCDTHPKRRACVTYRYVDVRLGVEFDRDLCDACYLNEAWEAEHRNGFWEPVGVTPEGVSLSEHRQVWVG